jgi:hypothetical protein
LPTTGSGLSATGSTSSEGSFKATSSLFVPKKKQGTIKNEEEFPTLGGEAATTKKV